MTENKKSEDSQLENYEKIRSVGKGAYGTAFLYRNIPSDSLVVIKEINMIEATAEERQMALNEVKVLSFLNHPNIISYYQSFEKDGILMIEMEYADGGTLAQFLKSQTHPMNEQDILLMFGQIVSAIRYMHDHNILHRDLKTANVFLTIDKIVKVGDFGISKVMTTKAQAETVVGTPYYISPEMSFTIQKIVALQCFCTNLGVHNCTGMINNPVYGFIRECEGKRYGPKSDIWALGCILYEMACLQKTFDGSNLLVLVNKIIKGQFQTPTGYSFLFQKLLSDLLKKDPDIRPSAEEIEDLALPQLISFGKNLENVSISGTERQHRNEEYKCQRSVLYELKNIGSLITLNPIALPPKSQILQVASSKTHCLALTKELKVYSWGEGKKGQLGHGTNASSHIPELVNSLRDKNIKIVGAGEGFSVFVSETGMIMTCGDGSFGCLGHGDLKDLSKPKILEKLLSVDVTAVGCGSHHVVILDKIGTIYSWGCGHDGCLGLGNEDITAVPSIVPIPRGFTPHTVRCGYHSTVIISIDGLLLGWGNNSYNKLGLSVSVFKKFQTQTEKILTPTKIKNISARIVDVALGSTHSVFLTDDGLVLTLGNNQNSQLGRYPSSSLFSSKIVKKFEKTTVTMIHCNSTFSVVGTLDNMIYFWGSKCNENNLTPSTCHEKSYSSASEFHKNIDENKTEVYKEPKEILGLYASKEQIKKNQTLTLTGINTFKNNLMILVDTNTKLVDKLNYPLNKPVEKDGSSDNIDSIPEWIKLELAESVEPWTGFKTTSRDYVVTHKNS